MENGLKRDQKAQTYPRLKQCRCRCLYVDVGIWVVVSLLAFYFKAVFQRVNV